MTNSSHRQTITHICVIFPHGHLATSGVDAQQILIIAAFDHSVSLHFKLKVIPFSELVTFITDLTQSSNRHTITHFWVFNSVSYMWYQAISGHFIAQMVLNPCNISDSYKGREFEARCWQVKLNWMSPLDTLLIFKMSDHCQNHFIWVKLCL